MKKRETTSITIRLPNDLIKWIDQKVDGVHFRNRTHLIEIALEKYKKK